MPYLSITCVIIYVIGHALGPSMCSELVLCFPGPLPAPSATDMSGLSSLEGLQGRPVFLLQWGVGSIIRVRTVKQPV